MGGEGRGGKEGGREGGREYYVRRAWTSRHPDSQINSQELVSKCFVHSSIIKCSAISVQTPKQENQLLSIGPPTCQPVFLEESLFKML